MIHLSISQYRTGFKALNNLIDMLQLALTDALPGVELARTAAWGWRGFQIRSFQNLARGQYYCQFYLDQPNILIFEEVYKDGSLYHYPWRVDHDLLSNRFFELNAIDQHKLLLSIIEDLRDQAVAWQQSTKRQHTIHPRFLSGRTDYSRKANLTESGILKPVSQDYLLAIGASRALFDDLRSAITRSAVKAGISKPFITWNESGWDYRGFWMKKRTTEPDDIEPAGSFPYRWKTHYFDDPAILWFEGAGRKISLDLADQHYFNLDKETRTGTLEEFVLPIMKTI